MIFSRTPGPARPQPGEWNRRGGGVVQGARDWTAGRPARGLFFVVEPGRIQLNELSRLIDAGAIRPIVDAALPLERAREAYERGIVGHPRGKLVLAVSESLAR